MTKFLNSGTGPAWGVGEQCAAAGKPVDVGRFAAADYVTVRTILHDDHRVGSRRKRGNAAGVA